MNDFNYVDMDLALAKKMYAGFTAIDVETTGLSPDRDRIVELGVVKFRNGKPQSRFTTFVSQPVPISPGARAVNQITDQMLAGAPSEAEAMEMLAIWAPDVITGKEILVAHNASFDIGFLGNALDRTGIDAAFTSCDTLQISRQLISGPRNYKLPTLAEYLGIPVSESHRAAADAETCGRLMVEILKALGADQQPAATRKRRRPLADRIWNASDRAAVTSLKEKGQFNSDYRTGIMFLLVLLAILLFLALNMFKSVDLIATAATFIALVLLLVFVVAIFLFFKSAMQPKKASGYILTILVSLAVACFLWMELNKLAAWLETRPGANYIRGALVALACLIAAAFVSRLGIKILRRKTVDE